uniref:Plasma membrane proteolipid 3 n=1 Tax=Plectus sambesii TaxID=2011161 RepID=A0A914XI10_9BILA
MSHGCSTCCLIVLAILIPPLAVFFTRGCTCHLVVSLILTFLGWIPGTLHALWVICDEAESHHHHHHHHHGHY